jgi:hypothetical protein
MSYFVHANEYDMKMHARFQDLIFVINFFEVWFLGILYNALLRKWWSGQVLWVYLVTRIKKLILHFLDVYTIFYGVWKFIWISEIIKTLNEKGKGYPGYWANSGPWPPLRRKADQKSWGGPRCWPNPAAKSVGAGPHSASHPRVVTTHLHRAMARMTAVHWWPTINEVHG